MDKITLEYLTKHGVAGVLAVWLVFLHMEVKEVKRDLKECMNARITSVSVCTDEEDCSVRDSFKLLAVLPDRLRIKIE